MTATQRGIRSAVVGAGLMGRWHARELARAGGALVAVADPDPAAARLLASSHPRARPFDRIDRLVEEVAPQVVHVCTPTGSHAEIVERALEGGAHVLVEKPLAPDAAHTERLIEAAQSRGLLLCPVHQYIFQPGVRLAQRMLERVGPVLHLESTACSAGGVGRADSELDSIAGEILPHPLAVLQRLVAGDVDALEWGAMRTRPGELRAIGHGEGFTVALCVSMEGRPTRNELRVIGTTGTIRLDFFHGYGVLERGGVSRLRKVAQPFSHAGATAAAAGINLLHRAFRSEPGFPGLRELIRQLYAASLSGGSPPISARETLAVARARDRLLSALGSGDWRLATGD
jgi:predicted dehydrogenase